jgi:tetratricopeptide (TPR) repeat protein
VQTLYSRLSKLIPNDEYERLFNLAIQDHNQARAKGQCRGLLQPGADVNDRGSLESVENKSGKSWFDEAAVDFEKAIEKDPQNDLAFDRLGLTYESNGEEDKAIRAYTQEMALNRFGKCRLADAYCNIGFRHQQQKDFAAAMAAYQKSTEFGIADDKTAQSNLSIRWSDLHD